MAEQNFAIDLQPLLETQQFLTDDTSITLDNDLLLNLRPFNFEQRNLTLLNEIQESQAIRILESNEEFSDTDKMIELSKHVSKMADRTFDILSKSIVSVTIIPSNTTVTNPEHINDFLHNISKHQADAPRFAVLDV